MQRTVTLLNGVKMPVFGFGTWQLKGDTCKQAVKEAVKVGYRLLDSASIYRSGKIVGAALAEIGRVPKGDGKDEKDLFITSKIEVGRLGFDNVLACHKEILEHLGIPKLDLLLLHWPGSPKHQPSDPENRKVRIDSWRAMEKLYNEGQVRAIGVSNYLVRHLDQLKEDGATITPMVNQVELHPYCFMDDLDDWAKKNSMQIQGYSSLGSGKGLLEDPVVKGVAKEVSKTPAQLLLGWGLQRGYLVIPRSSNPERIRENANCFDFTLSDEQMKRLNGLQQRKHFCWNPETVA